MYQVNPVQYWEEEEELQAEYCLLSSWPLISFRVLFSDVGEVKYPFQHCFLVLMNLNIHSNVVCRCWWSLTPIPMLFTGVHEVWHPFWCSLQVLMKSDIHSDAVCRCWLSLTSILMLFSVVDEVWHPFWFCLLVLMKSDIHSDAVCWCWWILTSILMLFACVDEIWHPFCCCLQVLMKFDIHSNVVCRCWWSLTSIPMLFAGVDEIWWVPNISSGQRRRWSASQAESRYAILRRLVVTAKWNQYRGRGDALSLTRPDRSVRVTTGNTSFGAGLPERAVPTRQHYQADAWLWWPPCHWRYSLYWIPLGMQMGSPASGRRDRPPRHTLCMHHT